MSEELPKEVAQRILSLRQESDGTWKAFAERIGLTQQTVSNWRKQGTGASLDAAATVLEHHKPRLSPAWLLVGLPPRYLPEGVKLEDVVRKELEDVVARLDAIRQIAAGEISPEALRAAEEAHRLGPPAVTPDEIRRAIALLRGSESTEKARP